VFHRLLGIETEGLPYWAFAAIGLTAWYYFSGTVETTNTSLIDDNLLVTKVYFPRILVPLAASLPALVDVALASAVILVALLITGAGINPAIALSPLLLVALVAVTAGVGLLSATFTVRYRDTRHVTTMGVQLLFFATPLAYPSSVVPHSWRPVYFANPLAGIVEGLRWSVAGGPGPGLAALMSAVGGLVVIVAGLLAYLAGERRMADVI
jgi:lipopolysaccharide transport system permease protein